MQHNAYCITLLLLNASKPTLHASCCMSAMFLLSLQLTLTACCAAYGAAVLLHKCDTHLAADALHQ